MGLDPSPEQRSRQAWLALDAAIRPLGAGSNAVKAFRVLRETLSLPQTDPPPAKITALARQRWEARLARNWTEADKLKKEILALGYTTEDIPATYCIRKL